MKVRNGFVSNSSSSSFMIIGFVKSLYKGDDINDICSENYFSIVNDVYVGQYVDTGLTYDQFKTIADKLTAKFNIDTEYIMLYSGEESC